MFGTNSSRDATTSRRDFALKMRVLRVLRGDAHEASVFLTIQNDGGKDTLIGARTSITGTLAESMKMRGSVMVLSKALPVPAKIDCKRGLSCHAGGHTC